MAYETYDDRNERNYIEKSREIKIKKIILQYYYTLLNGDYPHAQPFQSF